MAGSVHIAMFIVARIISGVGGGMLTSNCPVYMSEVSPSTTRGILTSVHGVGITVGYIFASILALAFSFVTASYQWRLTFAIFTFCSLVLLASLPFIPESPRWLVVCAAFLPSENNVKVVADSTIRNKRDMKTLRRCWSVFTDLRMPRAPHSFAPRWLRSRHSSISKEYVSRNA
jgi:MFS family permease